MKTNRDVLEYATISKVLHWLIALLVFGLIIAGFFVMPSVEKADKAMVYGLHKSLGLTVLCLMFIRLIAILYYRRPPLPLSVARWEVLLSKIVQYGLYVLLFMMPLSGWLMSCFAGYTPIFFGGFSCPFPGVHPDPFWAHFFELSHKTIVWVLLIYLFLHISGALKHQWIDKDDVLKRMWFKWGRR